MILFVISLAEVKSARGFGAACMQVLCSDSSRGGRSILQSGIRVPKSSCRRFVLDLDLLRIGTRPTLDEVGDFPKLRQVFHHGLLSCW